MKQRAKIGGLPAVEKRFTASLAHSSEFVLRIEATTPAVSSLPAYEACHEIPCQGPFIFERRCTVLKRLQRPSSSKGKLPIGRAAMPPRRRWRARRLVRSWRSYGGIIDAGV